MKNNKKRFWILSVVAVISVAGILFTKKNQLPKTQGLDNEEPILFV